MPIGHLGVNVSDLVSAKTYFDELMPLLAFEPFVESEGQFSYRPAGDKLGTDGIPEPPSAGGRVVTDLSPHLDYANVIAFQQDNSILP